MFGERHQTFWLIGAVVLATLLTGGPTPVEFGLTSRAQAQSWDQRYRRDDGPRGFFRNFFGPYTSHRYVPERGSPPQQVDHSHAPSPPKTAKNATPTTTIVVMGDGMADWLGYGLEDAFADQPEVAIVRMVKQRSGLIRYDAKDELDWWHVARDDLSRVKANYVVMMLGLSDRQNISEKNLAKETEKRKAEKELANKSAGNSTQKPDQADKSSPQQTKTGEADQSAIAASEPQASAKGVVEFRSKQWAKIYSRRIDETIAALKSKGVPVFWVGLPSIRGTKSTADAVYLNDLFRARAERAGIVYVDVWDGFVDDAGKFASYGPDYEGQRRQLRTPDGVFFTKYGARKLAHYVEREIHRYMSNHALTVSLPTGPLPAPGGKSAKRPTVGPVVPLTALTGNSDQLLGSPDSRPVYGDDIANDVLVKGEPVNPQPGRADDFFVNPQVHAGTARKGARSVPATGSDAKVPARKTAIRQVEPTRAQMLERAKAPQPAPLRGSSPKPKSASGSTADNDRKTTGKQETTADNQPLPPANTPSKPAHHSTRPHSFFLFNWLH